MNDKDEILAAIAANHADLVGKVDVIAGGVLRIEAELATVKHDVVQLRVDVAAYRMEADQRLTALEAKLA